MHWCNSTDVNISGGLSTRYPIFGLPRISQKNGLKESLSYFFSKFLLYLMIFFSKFCCTLCSKYGFRVAFPTIVNINVNLYLVWKVVENVHFYVNFSKQKNLDLIYWYIKRSENSQQFWLKIYLDYLSNWTHLILLLVFLLCRSNFHLKIIAIFLFHECTMFSKICNKSAISGSHSINSFLQRLSTKVFPKKDVKFKRPNWQF